MHCTLWAASMAANHYLPLTTLGYGLFVSAFLVLVGALLRFWVSCGGCVPLPPIPLPRGPGVGIFLSWQPILNSGRASVLCCFCWLELVLLDIEGFFIGCRVLHG